MSIGYRYGGNLARYHGQRAQRESFAFPVMAPRTGFPVEFPQGTSGNTFLKVNTVVNGKIC